MSEALLVVRDVRGGYRPDFPILRGIDLEVREGEIVCLIGPNGAGKSTLLKAISGSVPHVQGSIVFRGQKITGLPPYQTLQLGIAYVPQGRRVFPWMTVQENLEMGAYTLTHRAAVKRRIEEVFHVFPILAERRRQLAYSLSGGEQQMLAIARGLMLQPRLLMLDEPSLGLAPKGASLVLDKLRELNENGVTLLFVEQQARRGLRFAQRGYVLVAGRTRLSDRADRLLDSDEVRALYVGGAAEGGHP